LFGGSIIAINGNGNGEVWSQHDDDNPFRLSPGLLEVPTDSSKPAIISLSR